MFGRLTWRAVVVCMTMAAAGPSPAGGHESRPARVGPATVRLLDVPYVSQSAALCGGAAVSMVLRYWGEPALVAEDFSALLEPDGAGIRTDRLVAAVRARGWSAYPVSGTAQAIQDHLAHGRPVIALVAAGPGAFHYVVLLAWANDGVILHDPAVGPFRTQDAAAFDAAWAASGRWALVIVTAAGAASSPAPDSATARVDHPPGPAPCDSLVANAIRLARGGDAVAAESLLVAAQARCPGSAAPVRGRAGLRFAAEDWAGAARLAEQALALDAADAYTWRLLGASRFLLEDDVGALRAWNHVAEPRADLARIDGLDRIRYRAVADQLDLPAGTLLSAPSFIRARRRLAAIPAQSQARLRLRPLAAGSAQVSAAVLERPLLFSGRLDAGAAGVRALVDREATLRLASPLGHGELWTAGYRWPRERPRVSLGLDIPAPGGHPGIWRVEGSWERQAYAGAATIDGAGTQVPVVWREERRRSALSFSDWVAPDLRLELGAAYDRWAGRGAHVSLAGGVDARFAGDRVAVTAQLAQWTSLEQGAPFRSAGAEARWHTGRIEHGGWRVRLGAATATADAPLALWSGAGTGQGREPLLRAHPLLDQGVVTGRTFGRMLAYTGIERQAWAWSSHGMRAGWSLFVDGARAWETLDAGPAPLQVDAGASLRLAAPGGAGEFRIAAAHGLADGRSAISVAWGID
jgi:hypothetical protein